MRARTAARPVPRHVRRPARRVLLAVVLAGGLAACSGGDGGAGGAVPQLPQPGQSRTPAPGDSESAAPESSGGTAQVSTGVGKRTVPSRAAVTRFLNAIRSGKAPAAYEAMSPQAQQAWGSAEEFGRNLSGFAEGAAAFSSLVPSSTVVPLNDDVVVVTMSGQVTREGQKEFAAYALPVRFDQATVRVEVLPGDAGTRVVITKPAAGDTSSQPHSTPIAADLPAGSTALVLGIDGFASTPTFTAGQSSVQALPNLDSGPHAVTVAVIRADGLAVAGAQAFTTT